MNELDVLKDVVKRLVSGKIDFMIRKNEAFRIHEFENKKKIKLDDLEINIVSLEDLIISKIYWMKDTLSEVQKRDILNLMKRKIDTEYIEYWSEKLGILDIFKGLNHE